jgi:pimeloyl-ACP methyl ester carboxylesterase
MEELYLFSGLGADSRVFMNLDLSGYNVNYIKWISPNEKEFIEDYAKRLVSQIKTSKPTLIGLSFGGMVAIEVSKLIGYNKLIIVSSVKTRNELPSYFRIAGTLGLHKLAPLRQFKKPSKLTNWLFGVTDPQDIELLNSIMQDTDLPFFKWAVDRIVNWNNTTGRDRLYHIHGGQDRILPNRFLKSRILIEKGGHLMILNMANDVSVKLREILLK